MPVPAVTAERPAGFDQGAAEMVERPPLGSGSGAAFTQWEASRSANGANGANAEGTLLLGCIATPIPGWVDDMRPAVEARTVALMHGSAERVAGVPLEARAEGGVFSLRQVGTPENAPRIGVARTFVGWDATSVSTCFAVCATSKREKREEVASGSLRSRCDASVLGARLEGSLGPPPPGFALGAVTWAVHHPSQTVLWGGALAFALGVVAVASRRRPRSRI